MPKPLCTKAIPKIMGGMRENQKPILVFWRDISMGTMSSGVNKRQLSLSSYCSLTQRSACWVKSEE